MDLESSFFAVKDHDAERKRRRANGSMSSDEDAAQLPPPVATIVSKPRPKLPSSNRVGKPASSSSGSKEGALSFRTLEHFSGKAAGAGADSGAAKSKAQAAAAPPRVKIDAKKAKDERKGASSSSSSSASNTAAPAKEAVSSGASNNSSSSTPDALSWLKLNDLVVWAKMGSFPPWPARFCSAPEVERLEKSSKLRKSHQAVVFLGITRSLAWVPESGITEFNAPSFNRTFSSKLFQKERDYQASVIEAVRRTCKWYAAHESDDDTDSKGIFDQEVMELVQSTSFEWEREDCCYVCFGTEMSGVAVVCEHTSGPNDELDCTNESHLQCLAVPVIEAPADRSWFCDEHCEMHNIPKGTFQALRKRKAAADGEDNDEGDEEEEEERAGKAGRKKKERNNALGLSNGIVSLARRAAKEASSSAPAAVSWQVEEETDDTCFVCGEGGRLVLCDFALCRKAYHHSCVLKTSPLLVDSCNSSRGDACMSVDGSDDLWFCPRHTCACCSTVQQTKHPLLASEVPRYLLLDRPRSGGGGLVEQRQLVGCDDCPLSLCKQCETDISSRHRDGKSGKAAAIFKVRKTLIGDRKRVCVCCYCAPEPGDAGTSSGNALRLARLLEASLSRVMTSRLALPFLNPLLPGIYAPHMHAELERRLALPSDFGAGANATLASFLDISAASGAGEKSSGGGISSRAPPQCLLEIMDRIRDLGYSSVDEFLADLLLLRRRAACILEMDSNGSSGRSTLLDALDTVMSDIQLFSHSRGRGLQSAQQQRGGASDENGELVRSLFRLPVESGRAATAAAAAFAVQPRSRLLWEEFVTKGLLFVRNRGPVDPYAVSSLHTRALLGAVPPAGGGGESIVINERASRLNGKRLLGLLNVEEVVSESDAAGCLLNLSARPDIASLAAHGYIEEEDYDEPSDFASDPMELLSGVQRQTLLLLELHASLRQSYTDSVLSTTRLGSPYDDTVLELGKEGNILKEMKLSNEILREKIRLKDGLIRANEVRVRSLVAELQQIQGLEEGEGKRRR